MIKRTKKMSQSAVYAEKLAQALAIHRSVLATALCMFAPSDAKKIEDTTNSFVMVLGTCLAGGVQITETTEQSLINERSDDLEPRLARDAIQETLYTACVKTKQRLTNVLGDARAAIYGTAGITPQYGTALRDYAKDVVKLLTTQPLVIKDDVLGTLDTTILAQYLSAPLAAYSAALETVSKEEQELLNALNARDAALNALDLLASGAHSLASALAHLSNRDDLRAAFLRLKPSTPSPSNETETDTEEETETPSDATLNTSTPTT